MNSKKIFNIVLLSINVLLLILCTVCICYFTKSIQTLSVTNTRDVNFQINKIKQSVVSIVAGLNKDTGFRSGDVEVGTGFVYKRGGYVITNYHNIKDKSFFIITYDNKKYSANLISGDDKTDIAIVKVEGKQELTPVKFGNSKKCNVGDNVVAIGTPLSVYLKDTVVTGIISATDRIGFGNYKLIQSNIASSPGFSGGPLINSNGEVIGVNSFKSTEFGSEGLSFSIPSENVLFAISKLEGDGKVKVPYIGVNFAEDNFTKYGIPNDSGIDIKSIDPNSPAKEAGLKEKDKILSINNIKISNKVEYNEILKDIAIGNVISIKLLRDQKDFEIKIKIKEYR
ncbi:peptidase S1 and S6 chymotrypsin/Hap [Ruminiclostridium papyrosolvens DSM 2782]|uniref:Peptidase S1 and S6 chymotrypsin/Hap n=1 Tax=Ruminiclostridium papyrosolvens DSM 2782 TaxID=588581 RepID=F1TFI4_9FIRM|nr:S1C family serine protease [Ruminiclostridium papyrosolvens]EGD46716.1 peptidase S1 and S6 chymotrypsin/Hap [Ruminiclostridium papyrosolvens DSM 2782]WES34940.1 S1C family serine protease [Ruminiclostridium papyrosolvens DSM 2782]